MDQTDIIAHLRRLTRDRNPGHWDERTQGGAPHKSFLLLSIMDGIVTGWIDRPQITISQNLIGTFFSYWNGVMGEDRNTSVALPFFHMKSEAFWELVYHVGQKPYTNSPSLGGLQTRVKYAVIDPDFFAMMQDTEGRKQLTTIVLQTYFSDETAVRVAQISTANRGAFRYARRLDLLAAEPFVMYWDKEESHRQTLQNVQNREEGFSLALRRQYGHTCAVCRSRVQAPGGQSLVDGAHIVPWTESQNDDPRNGLALCKTHHWMFDRYLLTVKPDYTIQLSNWLKKKGEEIEQTLAWEHKQLLLPEDDRFMPVEEALADRYKQFKSAN